MTFPAKKYDFIYEIEEIVGEHDSKYGHSKIHKIV